MADGTANPMILWLDVEDSFHYGLRYPRPSGIQRLSYELYAELHGLLGEQVRFCRHASMGNALWTVPREAVRQLFTGLLAPSAEPARPAPASPQASGGGLARSLAGRLRLEMRDQLMQALASQAPGPLCPGSRAAPRQPSFSYRPSPPAQRYLMPERRRHAGRAGGGGRRSRRRP
jgi:hypothetical protein